MKEVLKLQKESSRSLGRGKFISIHLWKFMQLYLFARPYKYLLKVVIHT